MEQLAASGGAGRPACPACKAGRLHPYEVSFDLVDVGGVTGLSGWVAVCVGNRPEGKRRPRGFGEDPGEPPASEPCGFNMPLTPGPAALEPRGT